MARFVTTKAQLSAYRLMIRRVEQAFTRRDVRLLASPFSGQTISFCVGLFIASLVVAIGFLQAYLSPRADQNGASMVITKSGGYFVMYDDGTGLALHPVTNLASARLIVGKADIPKVVKDDSLNKQPRGQLMGVPSGPNNLRTRDDDNAQWTVCDKNTDAAELSLTKTQSLSTTLFAGTDSLSPAVTDLTPNDAILIKSDGAAADRQWLIYNGERTSIGTQDQATRAAINLTPAVAAKSVTISKGLFNAIPAAPTLTAPYIADRGRINPALPDVLNGDVIVTSAADGTREYHVALQTGVQKINEFIAQLLQNTGSKEIFTMSRQQLSTATFVSDIDISHYPDHAPTFRQPHVVCWSWTKGARDLRAHATIKTGESLPIAPENLKNVVRLLRSTDPAATANLSYTAPGRGWFVRVTGAAPESHANEQLLYIDDTGVRYFIGPDEQNKYDSTVHALGIGEHNPLPIPWSIAELYAPGSTLSKGAALTVHVLLPDDLHQRAIPTENQPTPGTIS